MLVEGARLGLDLETGRAQQILRIGVDLLEQQDADGGSSHQRAFAVGTSDSVT